MDHSLQRLCIFRRTPRASIRRHRQTAGFLGTVTHFRRASQRSLKSWTLVTAITGNQDANCSLAAPTIWSGSKPNFFCNSLRGADAPNVCMPIMRPVFPT
jgi:hypothetical protein